MEFLHRGDADCFSRTSIESIVRKDGNDKQKNDEAFAKRVFERTPWLGNDGLPVKGADIPDPIANPEFSGEGSKVLKDRLDGIIRAYNDGKPDEEKIKDKRMIDMVGACPYDSVYVMVDSIIVPHQKEHRDVNGITGTVRKKKTSSIANAYILNREGT